MDEGFILSNKYRMAVFDEIVSGESDVDRISKKHHIINSVVKKIVDKFIDAELIYKKDDSLFLTSDGEKIAAKIRGQEKV